MIDSKPWYFSKTIWASLIAVAAAIASALGFGIGADIQDDLAEVTMQLITVGASLLAIFGRLSAESKIALHHGSLP